MSTAPKRYIKPEEYLEIERKADHRSQYFNGEMFAMAGASDTHVQIATNIAGEMRQRLKGKPCRVGAADKRVGIPQTGSYTYPDVIVLCGEPRQSPLDKDTLLNPSIIFEVLSESTESFDRGTKFAHYQQVSSLTDYILVSQTEYRVERFRKQPSGDWLLSVFTLLGESVPFHDFGIELPLSEIYYLVELNQN
ncbi:MAG: Uma2 family endonuclease [Bacteroidota bacterium]